MSFADIVIVGAGFGGSIMAARLGEHIERALEGAHRIVLLERGEDPTGTLDPEATSTSPSEYGNRFQHSLAPDYLLRWSEWIRDEEGAIVRGAPSMNVIAGRGLGGGSNVYCGVSLRAPRMVFEQTREGETLWPAYYTRASLDPYYAKAEAMLRVHRMEWTNERVPYWQLTTKRDFVFAEGCRRLGATAVPLKIADHTDANEGWWTQGQVFEGRQSLTKNYLRVAHASGVELRSKCDVREIVPTRDGYVVRGTDRRHGQERPFEIECRMLVLGAGAVATTGLLLASEHHFDGSRVLDPAIERGGRNLGKHLSGNGDYGVTGMIGDELAENVEGFKGKPMSSFCPSFWREHQFIVIPFYAEPVYLAMNQISTLLSPEDPMARGRSVAGPLRGPEGYALPDWGLEYKRRLQRFGARMMTMGCLALDACEGFVERADDGSLRVRWPETDRATERRWSMALDVMGGIYESLGGEMFLDVYRYRGTVNTAHPLGGARMSSRDVRERGIVDELGESHSNPNLFIVDAAAIPSALGVNPSLTIAAIAESIADRLVRGSGTRSVADRLV